MSKVKVDGAPAVPGLRFRFYESDEDLARVHAVAVREAAGNGQEYTFTLEDMRRFYKHLSNCDLTKDLLMAENAEEVVAFSRARWFKVLPAGYMYMFFVTVVPELESSGLRLAMLRWNEGHLRAIAATHPEGETKRLEVWLEDRELPMIASLEAEGYARMRCSYQMTRPLTGPLPEAPLPEGLEVRPVDPADYRKVWDADIDACKDAWEPLVVDENHYQRWLDNLQFQPALWQVAWDGGEVAGAVQNYILPEENAEFNRRRGYTENIHVGRKWRGKGVAKALIASSFRLLRDRGMEEAALGVDALNPTGALNLYRSMGFEACKTYFLYAKGL
jgi:mycothiol synthase